MCSFGFVHFETAERANAFFDAMSAKSVTITGEKWPLRFSRARTKRKSRVEQQPVTARTECRKNVYHSVHEKDGSVRTRSFKVLL